MPGTVNSLAVHITITAETATYQNFQDIEDGKYSVIVTNVETLMQQDGGFEKLWKKPGFTSRLISLVWDEAHCVSKWAGFRPEYKEVNRLRFKDLAFLIPENWKPGDPPPPKFLIFFDSIADSSCGEVHP
ncbi:hypothetical protein C8R46DRAFT_1037757 [Mycena filopes]|nr:hypothetical protein C8R46DRAFT_1037754 [Mycena filopes]KAJ7161559.1 hypothetical protein C8R46DRAFT_1037757 [Mycena filopes]